MKNDPLDGELIECLPDLGLIEYQQIAMRTAKELPFTIDDLVHAALGATSECGELATTVKRSLIYGAPIDGENIMEEIGDALWFLSLAATAIETTLADCARMNIEKLKKRYPEKFTDQDALKRADKHGPEPFPQT